jgi:hypothetical protein
MINAVYFNERRKPYPLIYVRIRCIGIASNIDLPQRDLRGPADDRLYDFRMWLRTEDPYLNEPAVRRRTFSRKGLAGPG